MSGESEVTVELQVNGSDMRCEVPTSEMLIDTLRERLALTGTNLGCDHAACGACTVRVGDTPVASCSTFTWQVTGESVVTVEGLLTDGSLSAEQAAFAERSAFQCGYCTPGLLTLTSVLLDEEPEPTSDLVREWISANICRCTGYEVIIEAVLDAAERRGASDAG